MKIGILTSSRADFGIYYPLLKELSHDDFFQLEIIAFGTHLSKQFGYTLHEIENSGFMVNHRVETLPKGDTERDIAYSIGITVSRFSDFWDKNKFDLVLALGDRFEMFAAVTAGTPFNVVFAHIHAGETTLGAIDNAYRHCISLMSKLLFVSTESYKNRAEEIVKNSASIYNVGALSIDNLNEMQLLSIDVFWHKYSINLELPTILCTFHPETVSLHKNDFYLNQLIDSLSVLKGKYQIVITMPNADTMGLRFREKILSFSNSTPEIFVIESFGMVDYLSCMKYCSFLLGNTSSGFVEAAYFPKYVINLGERQKGRIETPNIYTIPVNAREILATVKIIETAPPLKRIDVYGDGTARLKIHSILKSYALR